MANRDVGVSICGVVVGVMLGAGSVLYAQDATLSANSSDVAYRGQTVRDNRFIGDADDYKSRNTRQTEYERKVAADKKNAQRLDRDTDEGDSHQAAPEVDVSTCGVAAAIVARLSNVVTSIIPAQQEYEKFLKPIKSALGAVETDYCGSGETVEAVEVKMDKPSAPTKVDNDCEQYEAGSRRQAVCLGNEAKGQDYLGY